MSELNIPEGGHDAVLLSEHREMVEVWSEIAIDLDARVLVVFGEDAGRHVADVVPTLAYAHVAKAAFAMSSVAAIAGAEFDPDEFGKRCADIAREQIERCRQHQAPFLQEGA